MSNETFNIFTTQKNSVFQLNFFSNACDVLPLIIVLASPLLEESGNHWMHKVFKIPHFVFLKNYNIQVLVAHYMSPLFSVNSVTNSCVTYTPFKSLVLLRNFIHLKKKKVVFYAHQGNI